MAGCSTPFDALRFATEALGNEIYRRASYKSPWLNLIPRGPGERNKGTVFSSFTLGRIEPTADEETWAAVSVDDANKCSVTYNAVDWGHTERTHSPERIGLRGPTICQDDLMWGHNPDQFLTGYLHQLGIRSKRTVENRLLFKFMQQADKVVADSNYARVAQTTLVLDEATSELTQEMLDQTALELNEDGASEGANSAGWINLGEGGVEYPLLIGQKASARLLKNNSELRNDARYAFPNELFKKMGASRVINNFRHIINLFPPRYTYANGTYTRVNTWEMVPGTKGNIARIRSAWRSAPFEAALSLNPDVIHQEVFRPVNMAAGLKWNPKSYFGEWEWITGGREIQEDADCFDPRKKLGAHFGEYLHAIKTIAPEFGRMIIFKRCEDDFTEVTCST